MIRSEPSRPRDGQPAATGHIGIHTPQLRFASTAVRTRRLAVPCI